MFHAERRRGHRDERHVNFTTNLSVVTVLLAVLVVVLALASGRRQRDQPLRKGPTAIVLAIVVVIIIALCAILATRHGG